MTELKPQSSYTVEQLKRIAEILTVPTTHIESTTNKRVNYKKTDLYALINNKLIENRKN
jgi:hypothetical protein